MVSIIIPIYNRAHLIVETLDSITKQIYVDWECIIIDDGSTDNTINIIKKYIENDERYKLYKRPNDFLKGPSECRNYGFKLSKGNFIQFFDSDDIMHPDHLSEKITAIADADFVVCKLKEFDKEFSLKLLEVDNVLDIKHVENVFEAFVTGEFPMMMVAPMWRKESLSPYMPIRKDLHILEDHELYARALYNSKKYEVVNRSLIFYRVDSGSSTNSFYKDINYGLDSYLEAKKTVLKLSKSNKVKLAILKMTLGFFRMGLAQKQYKEAEKCLNFIMKEELPFSFKLQLKMIRIHFFYYVFKVLGRGDTKCKSLLKL